MLPPTPTPIPVPFYLPANIQKTIYQPKHFICDQLLHAKPTGTQDPKHNHTLTEICERTFAIEA